MRKAHAGMQRRRVTLLVLALLATSQLGSRCAKFAGIRWEAPAAGALLVEGSVVVKARLGVENGESSVKLLLQGVDLAFELGLTPPFTGAAGVVMIGGDPVTVSEFSIHSANRARRVEATFSGLSPAVYRLEVSGVNPETMIFNDDTRDFRVVDFFTLEASTATSAGLPGGPVASGSEGVLANASLGQAIASPPLPTLGGRSVLSGHVEAAEALIAGGP